MLSKIRFHLLSWAFFLFPCFNLFLFVFDSQWVESPVLSRAPDTTNLSLARKTSIKLGVSNYKCNIFHTKILHATQRQRGKTIGASIARMQAALSCFQLPPNADFTGEGAAPAVLRNSLS